MGCFLEGKVMKEERAFKIPEGGSEGLEVLDDYFS